MYEQYSEIYFAKQSKSIDKIFGLWETVTQR